LCIEDGAERGKSAGIVVEQGILPIIEGVDPGIVFVEIA